MLDRVLDDESLILSIDQTKINDCNVYIISVGTPAIDNQPSLEYLEAALYNVGSCLSHNDLVMLRSTVPVGTTRKFASTVLDKTSGLRCGLDYPCLHS